MKVGEALLRRKELSASLARSHREFLGCVTTTNGVGGRRSPRQSYEQLQRDREELASLIIRINRTNIETRIDDGYFEGMTVMQLIAERDTIKSWLPVLGDINEKVQRADLVSRTPLEQQVRQANGDVIVSRVTNPIQLHADLVGMIGGIEADYNRFAERMRRIDLELQSLLWTTDLVD